MSFQQSNFEIYRDPFGACVPRMVLVSKNCILRLKFKSNKYLLSVFTSGLKNT